MSNQACESCGGTQGVRRLPCPFAACPPAVYCSKCRDSKAYLFRAERHSDCPGFVKGESVESRKKRLLAQGEYILMSAINSGNGYIHALFKNNGEWLGRYIPQEFYFDLPKYSVVTLGQLEGLHGIQDAPIEFSCADLN